MTKSDTRYNDLTALFINTTLKKLPQLSHTDGLWQICKTILHKNDVQIDEIRWVDHDVALGVKPDMTAHGWKTDEWPTLYQRVQKANILIIGTPIWLGEKFFCMHAFD